MPAGWGPGGPEAPLPAWPLEACHLPCGGLIHSLSDHRGDQLLSDLVGRGGLGGLERRLVGAAEEGLDVLLDVGGELLEGVRRRPLRQEVESSREGLEVPGGTAAHHVREVVAVDLGLRVPASRAG